MADRFERLFQLPQNLHSAGSPVIVVAGALLKDTQSQKVLVQLKFKNISLRKIKALKVQIAAYDVIGEIINEIREYQYLDLSVPSGGIFGANKAIIMPKTETRSFSIEALWVVLDNDSVQNVTMPLVALPEGKPLDEVLKHPELLKQFRLEVNERASYAPQEILDIWHCSCGTWNRTDKCSECGFDRESLFRAFDPTTLVENTKVRLRKEKAEREAQEEQARKAAEEEAKRFVIKDTLQNYDVEYAYCEQCGTQVKKGVNFCRYCGSRIANYQESVVLTSEQITTQAANQSVILKRKKKTRVKRFVLVMSLISVFLALVYGVFTFTVKVLEDNNASSHETVKPQTTKPVQSITSKSKTSTPTEPKENIEHMVSFMKGYNYYTYDFNEKTNSSMPLLTLDDIRSGTFKPISWSSFDIHMTQDKVIDEIIYGAPLSELLNEENVYYMLYSISAIMCGMDGNITEIQRSEYINGILSFDFSNGAVYQKRINGINYELDIPYSLHYRFVATK